MTDTIPPAEAPLPRLISWFMPWESFSHWTPWKRWMLFAVVLLVGYIEVPVAVNGLVVLILPNTWYS